MNKSNDNQPLRKLGRALPAVLTDAPHRIATRNDVHIYTAMVPASIWRRVTMSHATNLFLGETGSGSARWLSPTGKLLDDLHPGDVWMIPPGLETTCEFHTVSDVLVIAVPPRLMGSALARQSHHLTGHSKVMPFSAYCEGAPVIRDLHTVVYSQSNGQPFTDLPHTIDPGNAALALARDLWLRYYCAVRTNIGKLTPDEVADELADG